MMIRKQLFNEAGGLDEDYKSAYGDIDLCLKLIKKGYYNLVLPDVKMSRYSQVKSTAAASERQHSQDAQLLKDRWESLLEKDPFYNPNLTLESENFSIKIN